MKLPISVYIAVVVLAYIAYRLIVMAFGEYVDAVWAVLFFVGVTLFFKHVMNAP